MAFATLSQPWPANPPLPQRHPPRARHPRRRLRRLGIAKCRQDGDYRIRAQRHPWTTVQARVSLCKRRHAEARITAVLERAPGEVDTPHQAIPGAPYITLPLEASGGRSTRSTSTAASAGLRPRRPYAGWVDLRIPLPQQDGVQLRRHRPKPRRRSGRGEEDGFFLGFKARGMVGGGKPGGRQRPLGPHLRTTGQGHPVWCRRRTAAVARPEAGGPASSWSAKLTAHELLVNLVNMSDGLDRFDSADSPEAQEKLGGRLAGSSTPSTTTPASGRRPGTDAPI